MSRERSERDVSGNAGEAAAHGADERPPVLGVREARAGEVTAVYSRVIVCL